MRRTTEFGSAGHLVGRFFGSLWPGGPSSSHERWASQWLLPGEQELWRRMSGPDRRHAVRVAHDTAALLDADTPRREVMASALLHDVGKVEAGFGTIGRAVITALAVAVGRGRLAAAPSARHEGRLRRRTRLYFTHDQVGAELLEGAGSDQTTVSWAREHHLHPDRWTVDQRVAHALKAADGD